MSIEKVQYKFISVKETLDEQEHRKVLSKRIEDAAQLLWETHVGLVGSKLKENPVLISYEQARVTVEAAMSLLAPLIKSLEEGEKVFDASKTVGGKQ